MGRWWQKMGDPLLDVYVTKLFKQNLSLEQAAQRIAQAQEYHNTQTASFWPSLSGSSDTQRSFTPASRSSLISTNRSYTSAYTADLNVSWMLDLFGKIRRSAQSSGAAVEASIYDREALAHSLIAELFTTRIAIATYQRYVALAASNIKNRQQTYELVKRRYDLGVGNVALSDVYLAQQNLTSVRGEIHSYERVLQEEMYKLDVMLGQMPGTTNPIKSRFSALPPPIDVATCLPADLLDRRPDLKASELRVRAASADIGVAIADLYPSLTLGGAIGFTGQSANGLLTSDQLAGSIFSSILMPLFEGGALRANVRMQEAEAKELSAAYAESILESVREVETALNSEANLLRELRYAQESVDLLRAAEKLAKDRYQRGIETLRNYLDTQQSRYAAEQALLELQQQKWNARVALYLALGGDWYDETMQKTEGAKARCSKEKVEKRGI